MQLKTGLTTLIALGLGASLSISGCGDDEAKKDPRCDPGESVCTSDFTGVVCPDVGPAQTFECTGGDMCDEGECVTESCVPDETECAGTTVVRTCSSDGETWVNKACEVGQICGSAVLGAAGGGGEGDVACIPGEGEQLCDPGSVECATATSIKTCENDGSDWVVTPCAAHEMCDAGECVPDGSCTKGSRSCADETTVELCNDDREVELMDCPGDSVCNDGFCEGTECRVGDSYCEFPSLDNQFSCADKAVRWVCEDGSRFVRRDCGDGAACLQDSFSQREAIEYGNQLQAFFYDCYYNGCDLSQAPRTPSLGAHPQASCVTPECDTPYFGASDFGSFYYGFGLDCFGEEPSVVCGDPNDEMTPLNSAVSACRGLLPFSNQVWETSTCEEYETCSALGFDSRSLIEVRAPQSLSNLCSSECVPGETQCDYNGGNNYYVCQDDGTWGELTHCGTDDAGYQRICRSGNTYTGGGGHMCMDAICSYWYGSTQYDDEGNPMALGGCDDAGEFVACDDEGHVEDAVACDPDACVIYTTSQYSGLNPGYCGPECEDGEQRCVGQTAPSSYVECVDGRWSIEHQYCAGGTQCSQTPGSPNFDGKVSCGDQCYPGDTRCVGAETQTCRANRTWGESVTCPVGVCLGRSGGGTYCARQCVEGAKQCSGILGEQTCVDGRMGAAEVCPEGTECHDGVQGRSLGCVECVGAIGNYYYGVADATCDTSGNLVRCQSDNTFDDGTACDTDESCVASEAKLGLTTHSQHATCSPLL